MLNTEQEKFDNCFEDYLKRNPHFVSPGAKVYYHRVLMGYVILAVACIVGIWSLSNLQDKHLRTDINKLGVAGCLNSIGIYNKFNDSIQTQIDTQKKARRINLMNGLNNRVALNEKTIKELESDKIKPPTKEECRVRKTLKE